ncbi:hypothetical protein LO772_06160 [Yinghuangia sp. ASG 101]|uniref:hypothetical protein n=1 Tax=Yinghuangia sp. ASG 101 TaxID=2896848 RepID=UPI001E5B7203|nr:hypothetical protein [Yinghuangia sp. ASG 101]UGQ13197.1 hypothetical protein LO772_06160 [Yinghuangia sp. ASG 101]
MTTTSTEKTTSSDETRADKFVRELSELKIADPAAGQANLWLRIGGLLMLAGLVMGISAYFIAHNTESPLTQRDGIALGLGGIAVAVVGSALFLRYSLTGFLRFWMARQSFDLNVFADRMLERESLDDLAKSDSASR